MASIFKRKRDKGKKHASYWIQYIDHAGKRRTKKGYTDKRKTESLAANLEQDAQLRRDGLIDPEQEKLATHRNTNISEHLDAFEESLGDNTSKHIRLVISRARRIITEGCMKKVSDIDVESVERISRNIRKTENLGYRTYNHYIDAIYSFCNWMEENQRIVHNPLKGINRLNAAVDVRHPRRALEPHEFVQLVKSARESGVDIQCFSGEERARIYIISYMTGLRRAEIASLTPRSFDFESDPPTLTVEAAYSKHRRKDLLPLHPELVSHLCEWLKDVKTDEPLFPKLAKRRTWLMVKKDLERVGIPYQTDEGIADFHAAGRHTHITELLRNGATLPEAMKLARHSDIKMTMKYTHIGLEDQAKAIANLPVNDSWLHIGCTPGHADSHNLSEDDTESEDDAPITHCSDNGYDSECHKGALVGTTAETIRTRVQFPPPPFLTLAVRRRRIMITPVNDRGFVVWGFSLISVIL